MADLLEGLAQTSLAGFIITGDRKYGKLSLAEDLRRLGVGSMFIAPSHLLRSHPFAPASLYDPFRDDEEAQGIASVNDEVNGSMNQTSEKDIQISVGQGAGHDSDSSADDVVHNVDTRGLHALSIDRRRRFVIDDSSSAPPTAMFSKKKLPRGEIAGGAHILAVAVRERGSDVHANILRFFYSIPPSMEKALQMFTAVPKDKSLSGHLFSKRTDTGSLLLPSRN